MATCCHGALASAPAALTPAPPAKISLPNRAPGGRSNLQNSRPQGTLLFDETGYLVDISRALLLLVLFVARRVTHGYVTLESLGVISQAADLQINGGDLVDKLLPVHNASKARELTPT